MYNRIRIQQTLLALANSTEFPVVTYDKNHVPDRIDCDNKKAPVHALCNEISGRADRDARCGTRLRMQRTDWNFQLIVTFDCEVVLDDLVNSLIDEPPVVVQDKDAGLNQVILLLSGWEVEHPTTKNGITGTEAKFLFSTLERR